MIILISKINVLTKKILSMCIYLYNIFNFKCYNMINWIPKF